MQGSYSGEGAKLGPYRIVKRLGIGGTSEVLLAVSQGPYGFERTVVIKRLLPKCEWDPAQSRMLAAEAVAYARLTHPAILRLYDFFAPDGHVALVLEFVDGPSLARLRTMLRTRREALGDAASYYIVSRVFAALAAAHSARDPHTGEFAPVVHRDVSPGNVLIPWDGFVKLGDFGLAKVTGLSGDTRSGTLKGTYGYMAPEQVLGDRVSPRTDVYAACLLLREMLLSRPTFTQGKMAELEFLRVMADPQLAPIETLRGGISPALADALRRGLMVDPEQRTLTASEMVQVLRHEVDLDRAHTSLVEKLARVRPAEPRASTPPHGTLLSSSPLSTTLRFNRFGIPSLAPDAEEIETRPGVLYDTPSTMTVSSRPRIGSLPESWRPSAQMRRKAMAVASVVVAIAAVAGAAMLIKGSPSRKSVKGSVSGSSVQVATPTNAATAQSTNAPPTTTPLPRGKPSTPTSTQPSTPPTTIARDAGLMSAEIADASIHTTKQGISSGPSGASGASSASGAMGAGTGEVITPSSMASHRVFVDGQFALAHSGGTLKLPCGRHTIRIGSHGANQSIDVPCGAAVIVKAR